MVTLEKALSHLEKRKKSLIRFVKNSNEPPSEELKEWAGVLQLLINLLKKEIDKNANTINKG
jgi:hypothetical protein